MLITRGDDKFWPRQKILRLDGISMKEKVDFELGQQAFFSGKHHDDCPFKLPHRRANWQRGYRDAMYQNKPNTQAINAESTQQHIRSLKKLLRPNLI